MSLKSFKTALLDGLLRYRKTGHGCLLLVAMSVMLVFAAVFWWCMLQKPFANVSVVILKLPRSGSSWFTELLNEYSEVYISKEIIQRKDLQTFSACNLQEHLRRALQQPRDKIAQYRRYYLSAAVQCGTGRQTLLDMATEYLYFAGNYSSRFYWDFWLHPSRKAFNSLRVLGFSLNPEYATAFDWSTAIPANTQIVVLYRENFVKTVISDMRGIETKLRCKAANAREGCMVSKTFTLNITEFVERASLWKKRFQEFQQFLSKHIDVRHRVHFASYESMLQRGGDVVVNELLRDVGEAEGIVLKKPAARRGEWKKRTSNDLSLAINNFDEMTNNLKRYPNCQLLYNQFVSKSTNDSPREKVNLINNIYNDNYLVSVSSCLESLLRKEQS